MTVSSNQQGIGQLSFGQTSSHCQEIPFGRGSLLVSEDFFSKMKNLCLKRNHSKMLE